MAAPEKKRVTWIDAAKGIGILCVILGHCKMVPNVLRVWVYSFHMPLFFFLGGVTFRLREGESFAEFAAKKAKVLILPYLFFAAFNWVYKLLTQIFAEGIDVMRLLKALAGVVIQLRETEYSCGIWFPCTFFLVLLVLRLAGRSKRVTAVTAAVSFCLGCAYYSWVRVKLPWAMDIILFAYPFMAAGWLCQKPFRELVEKAGEASWRLLLLAASFALSVGLALVGYRLSGIRTDMYDMSYGSFLLFLLAGLVGTWFVCLLCKLVSWKWLLYIGGNSLFFYGIHQVLVNLICRFVPRTGNLVRDGAATLLVTAATVLICLCFKPLYDWYLRRVSGPRKV